MGSPQRKSWERKNPYPETKNPQVLSLRGLLII
jgi:hypothetical protein